ncbi:MAG TPA: hypothetical protein VH373_24220 [Jatrophihabitantaceae bacterium]|jgi:hypothetical protein
MIRRTVLLAGIVLAVYLVGRGIAELFTIDYHDPSSYKNDWGGPSLAGVLAVHTGPALLIIGALFVRILRHRNSKGISS